MAKKWSRMGSLTLLLVSSACAHRASKGPTHGIVVPPLADSGEPLDAKALGLTPIALYQPRPAYPVIASAAGLSGTVVLSIVVDTDGHVKSARVIQGAGPFGRAALDAVEKWRFQPIIVNQQAVVWKETVTLRFHLPDFRLASGPASTELAAFLEHANDSSATREPFLEAARAAIRSSSLSTDAIAALEHALDCAESTLNGAAPDSLGKMLDSSPIDQFERFFLDPPKPAEAPDGAVEIDVSVTEEGLVFAARVRSSSDPSLERNALAAAWLSQFQPKGEDGRLIRFVRTIQVNFGPKPP